MTARIEAWLYTSGVEDTHNATQQLQLTDSGGGPITLTLSAPMVFMDALADFESQANAHATLNGTYAFTWDAAAKAVQVACSENFTLAFEGNLHAALGFSSASGHTGTTSYLGDQQAKGRYDAVRCKVGPLQEGALIDVRHYRHGRHRAIGWSNHDKWRSTLTIATTDAASFLGSYCHAGLVRVYQNSDDTTAVSATNPDGYAEGWIEEVSEVRQHRANDSWIRVDVVLAVPRTAWSPSAPTSPNAWTPMQYGWSHNLHLRIEGLEYIPIEKASGLTLPSGYSDELAILDIGDSAAVGADVDRDAGIGTGFPLTFKLLDDTDIAGWFTRATARTQLTQDETSSANPLNVADETDFTGSVGHIGKERFTYTGNAAGQITGVTRGTVGYAYPHKLDKRGVVSDVPLQWRGRHVELWASPIDPAGFMPGSTLEGEGEIIWRGFLSRPPKRDPGGDGWVFEALPLDRVLTLPLAAEVTGTVRDTEHRVRVEPSMTCGMWISGRNAANAEQFNGGAGIFIAWQPFDARSSGDLITASEAIADIVSTFNTAVTTYGHGGDLVGLTAVPFTSPATKLDFTRSFALRYQNNNNVKRLQARGFAFGQDWPDRDLYLGGGVTTSDVLNCWYCGPDVLTVNPVGVQPPSSLAVELDEGVASDVPTSGHVKIGDVAYSYANTDTAGALLLLTGLQVVNGAKAPPIGELVGETVTLLQDDGPRHAFDLALRALHSSGETNLRDSSYDKLDGQAGYGLPTAMVNQGSIINVLGSGFLGSIKWTATYGGRSLQDVLGGMLALSRRALVMFQSRENGESNAAKIGAIHTAVAGGNYTATITNADLLADVAVIETIGEDTPPTVIIVEPRITGGLPVDRIVVNGPDAATVPPRVLEIDLPIADRIEVKTAAGGWATSRFLSEDTAYVLEIKVGPWIDVRAGDSALLSGLTWPGAWDYATGQEGFTGLGVCVGRRTRVTDGFTVLTMLVGGQTLSRQLCPAVAVDTWAGTAANPTTIDVDEDYTDIFAQALAEDGQLRLLHYEPGSGSEVAGEAYTISAVTRTGGVCRLTVGSIIGGATLTALSHLTWPETANAQAFQKRFAHDADGGRWA